MASVSNQYAAKLFSEHPVAIWPLDDDASFISLISSSQKNLAGVGWSKTKCTVAQITNYSLLPAATSPFSGEDNYYEVVGSHSLISGTSTKIEITLNNAFQSQIVNQELKNLFFNMWVFQQTSYAQYYEFGYSFYDSVVGATIERKTTVQASDFQEWINLSETFDVSEFDTDSLTFFIRFFVSSGGGSGEYNFIIHGLSIGQWSETFCSESTGSQTQAIPLSAGLGSAIGIAADQYGPLSNNAYYVCENSKLLAKNDGVPLIFGSKNATRLYPGTNKPSLIFPSKGMLSERNKYQSFSLEFWMRIKPNTVTPKKIWGPIESSSGIYVSEGSLSLVIDDHISSYSVSEWYRPMLVHLVYNQNVISLLVNSEIVIEIDIDVESMNFLESEWFGFFSYEEIEVFEIDCISIMPYIVPIPVAKRRFVWGQGVGSQQLIDSTFKGKVASINFPNAKYSSNMIYPDKERWDAGYYNNLTTNTKYLSVPEYTLPNIFISNRNSKNWYEDNKTVNEIEGGEPFFTFRPNTNTNQTSWVRSDNGNWNEKCYLNFSAANILALPFNTVYGVFGVKEDVAIIRPLLHIVNTITGKRFEINVSGYEVNYIFDGLILNTVDFSGQEDVVVGFHIPSIIANFGPQLSAFFASYDSLQFFVGGCPDIDVAFETFEGKIYKFAVADSTSFELIEDSFLINGFVNHENVLEALDHSATYSVSPFNQYGNFFLDISVYSVWEEYYPLSYFAQYVKGFNDTKYYGLDFLQFNLGFPSYAERNTSAIQNNPWINYEDLDYQFSYPSQQTYEDLDNVNVSGFLTYEDLDLNKTVQSILDFSNSSVKTYATFQLLAEGANEPLSSFIYTKPLNQNKVIEADIENTALEPYRAYKTKFYISDGTVLYPPRNIDIEDVALNIHFVIDRKAILSNPLVIRDMEITSKALSNKSNNAIGTKFDNDVIPYTKSGIYYSYKAKNPRRISKKSVPYLYLTEDSGIKILNFSDNYKEYGAQIKINSPKDGNFYLGAAQLFMKYDIETPPAAPLTLFEITYKSGTVEFLAEVDSSGLRSKVFARDKETKSAFTNVTFYQNGIYVTNPYISYNEWNAIGIVFDVPLDLTGYSGEVNLFAGCTFNNISSYRSDGLNEISSVVARIWQDVLNDGNPSNYDWRYWYDEDQTGDINTWKNVYELASNQYYSLSAKDIFEAYSGTNINVFDDDTGISIQNEISTIISDVSWSSLVEKPV